MKTTLDLALTRWSVKCASWGELSSGNHPILGVFLTGWFWRDMGNPLPSREDIGPFCDSYRCGWMEANTMIAVMQRNDSATPPKTD